MLKGRIDRDTKSIDDQKMRNKGEVGDRDGKIEIEIAVKDQLIVVRHEAEG